MDNSSNQYDIIRRIRREGDAVLHLARDGADGETFRILKRYEPDIPEYAEPAYTNGLNRFIKDCEQYVSTKPAGCAVDAAEFRRDGKTVVLASQPFTGTPWKEYWRSDAAAANMSNTDKLRMLLPVLQTVAAANKTGVQFQAIDADSVYVARYTVVLADFGTAEPFEPWRQAYMLGRLVHVLGIDAASLPPALAGAVRRALFTDPATRYPDAESFARDVAAFYTTGQNPLPNASPYGTPYAAPKQQNKGCATAASITILVFLVLGIVTYIAMNDMSSSNPIPTVAPTWDFNYDFDMPDIEFPDFSDYDFMSDPPTLTTEPDYSGYDDDDYAYDDYRGAVSNAYVWYDYWDSYSLYDGLVTERNGTVFYRIRDKGEVVLVSENIATGVKKDLLWNFIPAFLRADNEYLYFIDCLDNFSLYRMPQTGGEPECIFSGPSTFITMDESRNSLYFARMDRGGTLTRSSLEPETIEALLDADTAANNLAFDASSGILYFVDANDGDCIYWYDPSANTVESLGLYGYDLQYSDGFLYYMGSTGFLYRCNTETLKSERILRDGVYAYIAHGDSVYYIDERKEYNVFRQVIGGGSASLILEEDVDMLWIAGGKLYYTAYDDYGAMKRCDLDGKNVEMLDRE